MERSMQERRRQTCQRTSTTTAQRSGFGSLYQPRERFGRAFDVYSFGILLAGIDFWTTFYKISRRTKDKSGLRKHTTQGKKRTLLDTITNTWNLENRVLDGRLNDGRLSWQIETSFVGGVQAILVFVRIPNSVI